MIRLVNFVLRLVLGGLFVLAAVIKIMDPAAFAVDIQNYRFLPRAMVHPVAILLPWVELGAGVLLVLGVWRRAAALVIAVLCVAFLVAISQALARGLDVHCGCFGTLAAGRIGWRNLVLDLVLLGMAVWLTRWQRE
ncbi:MAG: MauE/DoxX family redox-associated membrane protein [Verrucomicrobiae bacterium]|nr:MauE/DoxX family redox-associated membrane protein [Verrucomicrobiae bacterium]